MVSTGEPDERLHAASALGNLAHENTDNQNAIAEAGAIPPLVGLVSTGEPDERLHAAHALSELARKNPDNQNAIAEADAIPLLVDLANTEESVKESVQRAIENIDPNRRVR